VGEGAVQTDAQQPRVDSTQGDVFESQALRCWIAGHIHAVQYVCGVTAITVPDNPRQR
jgi:hypothetical protein